MPPMEQPIRVTFVDRASEIDAEVWSGCFRPPAEGLFWYETLELSGLEGQFRFSYALLTSGGRPVGIAPCFLHEVPISLVAPAAVARVLRGLSRFFPRLGYLRTLFVGSPCSDEGGVGLVHGVGLAQVAGSLREAVLAQARLLRAPMIVFKDFPEADLQALCGSGRLFATQSYPGTMVALPQQGKEGYYRSLSHTHRHNLLKKLRRSRDALTVETRVVKRPTDSEITKVFELFMQTYERGRTKFERLNLAFFAAVREHPQSWFILQFEHGGALVAFMLVFVLGDRVVNKFIGLDYGVDSRASLYFRLFDAALDFAYARGAKELQSGQTGYRAKLDLGHRLVPLFNVFRHENPVVDAVFRLVGGHVSWRTLDKDLADWTRAHPEGEWNPPRPDSP